MKGKIFIVDDDLLSLEFLRQILENEGYTVQTEDNSIYAVEKIRIFEPDLVLLDVCMPDIDGFEVCKRLKNEENTKAIPTIFLSVASNTEEKIKGFQAGAVDYMTKPFDEQELLLRVNSQIQLFHFRKEKVRQANEMITYSQQLEQEIAERKKIEWELKKAQEITHIGSWHLDIATNEVVWTEELYKMYGFDPKLPPPSYSEHKKLFTPESWELLSTALAETTASGTPYELELKTIKDDGSNGWMWVRGETMQDAKGKTTGLWGAAQDISKHKKNQEKLQQSNVQFNMLIDLAPDAFFQGNKHGQFILANKAALKLSGYSLNELLNMNITDLFSEEHLNDRALRFDLLENGETVNIERELIKKDRSTCIIEMHSAKMHDGTYQSFFRDITEKKNIEKENNLQKTELQEYFENDISADYLVSVEGEMISCNNTFLEMFRFEDKSHTDIFNITELYKHPADRKKMVQLVKKFQKIENYEVDFRDRKGNIVHTMINAVGIFNEKNKLQKIRGYVVDISALKKAEAELHESETKYRHLFENNPLPMWIVDAETHAFLEVNEAAVNHYGYSREEFLQMTIKDIRIEKDTVVLDQEMQSPGHNPNCHGVCKHLQKNGAIIQVNIISHNVSFENRNALMVVVNDITDRLKAEESIQNERNLLRTLIDHIPGPIYIKDTQGRKVIVNKADLHFLNVENESALIGKTDLEAIHGIIGARGYNDDMEVLQTGIPILNKEEYFILPNDDHRWLLTSKLPIHNQNGEIYGLVGIGRDITEQKVSNESILKLSIAIEQSPLSIVITNTRGEIEFTNPKFTEVTGYSAIEVKGQNARIIQSGFTPKSNYETMWNTISGGKEWRGEFHNRKKNGELYWESATLAPIINEKGEIINYIAIKEDITGKKQLLEELVASKANAEESDRLKSAFLANMSHEIRTPLNGILGFTELMIDPDFDDNQKADMARMILDNGDQLLAIINDVLDISKIESGQIDLRVSNFEANQLLFDLKSAFDQRAEVNHLELKLSSNIAAKVVNITCDYMKLKQVLSNLMSNAIKYSDTGTVEIGLKAGKSQITFYVKDTGIGIPKEFHEKIFDRFRHLEPNRSKLAGGNGLGLAISKSFIELMGGKIWVESEVGVGSTFFFSIPTDLSKKS
ncbi:MAG: PAS domain S-box protein [Prolixibacteraceae bacterium]